MGNPAFNRFKKGLNLYDPIEEQIKSIQSMENLLLLKNKTRKVKSK